MIGEKPARRTKLAILKVRPGERCEVQVLCDQVFSWSVHWVGNRSYVCPVEDCPACVDWECRWNGWLLVRLVNNAHVKRRGLLELSATTYDRLFGLLRMEGSSSWFGQGVLLERGSRRSPMVAEPVGILPTDGIKVAKPQFVWDALATLYGLPAVQPGESVECWAVRAAQMSRRLLERAVESARKVA